MNYLVCIKKYCLILCLCIGISQAWAQKDIQLNLQNADLREFVETVAKITGKNFVMSPSVQGAVTVISPEKFDKKALYDIFLNVLSTNGFTAVKGSGGVIRIVPSQSGEFVGYDAITQVHRLNALEAGQALTSVQPLLPPGSLITADSKNNLLIISGQPGDVRRAVAIVQRIDQSSSKDFDVIRLRYAAAGDIARTVSVLLGEVSGTKIVADERTNSILLQAPRQEKVRLRALITHLDTPIENAGNTEVIYLKNANAEAVAKTLQSAKNAIGMADGEGVAIGLTQNAQNAQASDSNVDIRADDATNSLIITAPTQTMRNLKQVIAKLDIRRSQVLVEAIIAEVRTDDIKNLGVQWYAAGSSGTIPIGLIDFSNAGSSILGLAASYYSQKKGGKIAVDAKGRPTAVAGGATLGVGNSKAGLLINALNGLTDSNILSTPSLLVMDNEEAEFLVGENIPYVTGSYTTNSSGSSNPFQTVEREDVGVKLKIKPQINEGNTISLEIYQEVSNVASTDAQLGPTTNKRALKTAVLVEDDQVLVLGGLISSQTVGDEQKVPLLGDIPLLGNLFKSTKKVDNKRNLMIFIRPRILRNQRTANYATQEKYDSVRQAQLAHPLATSKSTLPPINIREVRGENLSGHLSGNRRVGQGDRLFTPLGKRLQSSETQAPAPIYERSRPLQKNW